MRQTIAGLDNVRMTLIFQSLVLAGPIAFMFSSDTRPPQGVRITIEASLTAVSIGIFLLALIHAFLLANAIAVAKKIEESLFQGDKGSHLTYQMDKVPLAGGRGGRFFYPAMALIAPVASLVVLVLDSAGKL